MESQTNPEKVSPEKVICEPYSEKGLQPMPEMETTRSARPFLKWAGGKGRLMRSLLERAPKKFGTYYEPFLGGGAVFFALHPEKAVLSDINAELTNAFTVVRDDVESLIEHLAIHKTNRSYYQKIRGHDRRGDFWTFPPLERASRFIFLNKTCFNGLCRVNSDGQFNVPYGMYKNPKILDEVNLRACSEALQGMKILNERYDHVLQLCAPGDFVYFDPPYVALNATSSFVSYAEKGFSLPDQQALAGLCHELDKKGVQFMLTNSNTEIVRDLYSGFALDLIDSPRSVSADGSKRRPVKDIVVKNFE